jgi:hypothetical protein
MFSVSAKVPASTLHPASRDIVDRVRYADTETSDSDGPGVAREEVEGGGRGGAGGGGEVGYNSAEANELYVCAVQGRHSQKSAL